MRKTYELNRKTYKELKKMDHKQVSDFCEKLYREGYEDGRKGSIKITLEELQEIISGTKGIGEKKAGIIIEAIEERLRAKEEIKPDR